MVSAFEPHEGVVRLGNTFRGACVWLGDHGSAELQTRTGTRFEARTGKVGRGRHRGEKVIRFMQKGQESGRAYACCWGHYYNCNRTRIGMYCAALDAAIGS